MNENPPVISEKTEQPNSMKVVIIAAIGKNNELGKNNQLLWHLSEDMQFFKETTMHHHVMMGRKSFESIPPKYRPLPYRVNIIISRNPDYMWEECYTCSSLEEAIELSRENGEDSTFLVGGGQIYALGLEKELITDMYLTHVDATFNDADVFFPNFDESKWEKTPVFTGLASTVNEFAFEIYHYRKKE